MKLLFFWVLLQALCCSGFPQRGHGTFPTAKEALGVSLNHINRHSVGSNLYRVTHSSVKRIIPTGLNSYDILLKFGIRETVCLKTSAVNLETCDFRLAILAGEVSCTSQVQLMDKLTELLSISCDSASGSSSESSSEEMFRLPQMDPWHFNGNGGLIQPIQPEMSQPPGDRQNIDNHLDRIDLSFLE